MLTDRRAPVQRNEYEFQRPILSGVHAMNFFAELKRRNVYKVAITYAVVAWLLSQAGSILFPTFEAPA